MKKLQLNEGHEFVPVPQASQLVAAKVKLAVTRSRKKRRKADRSGDTDDLVSAILSQHTPIDNASTGTPPGQDWSAEDLETGAMWHLLDNPESGQAGEKKVGVSTEFDPLDFLINPTTK